MSLMRVLHPLFPRFQGDETDLQDVATGGAIRGASETT